MGVPELYDARKRERVEHPARKDAQVGKQVKLAA
jgi:hypothetical protein